MSTKRTRAQRAKGTTAGLMAEINRRRKSEQHDTSHLDALRAVPDEVFVSLAAEAASRETPVFAEVIRRVGIVPEPPAPWNDHTQLLPLVVEVDGRELVSAEVQS